MNEDNSVSVSGNEVDIPSPDISESENQSDFEVVPSEDENTNILELSNDSVTDTLVPDTSFLEVIEKTFTSASVSGNAISPPSNDGNYDDTVVSYLGTFYEQFESYQSINYKMAESIFNVSLVSLAGIGLMVGVLFAGFLRGFRHD